MQQTQMCKLEAEAAAVLSKNVPRSNILRLSLVRQVLWGAVGGKKFGPVKAFSGAGQKGTHRDNVKYEDWAPSKKKTGDKAGTRGGALAPGWWIVIPEKLAKGCQSSYVAWGAAPTDSSLRIVPYKLDGQYEGGHRNSFYIHGNGGKGSDGCILIEPAHRTALVHLVVGNNGAWLHAYISGTEMNDAFDKSQLVHQTA
jgi:hypothetical protein